MSRNGGNVINKHGLDCSQMRSKLMVIRCNIADYKPHELARDLIKLAYTIDTASCIKTIEKLIQEKETKKLQHVRKD